MYFLNIVKFYTAKIKWTRSFDNSTNKIEIVVRIDCKETVIVTL